MIFRCLFSLFVLLCSIGASAQATGDGYLLRQGDRLQISVWKEEALNREVRVLPDGSISFPLVGRSIVAGMTTTDVEKRVRDGLKAYIPEPVVSVAVTATEGNSVYVVGKVSKPGTVPLTSKETTVMQVLSQVGGLDRFANADGIVVLRKGADAQQQVLRVKYSDLIKGQALESNVVMRPGDSVMVP
jgi:polysaccharide export outer membrane protein